MGDGAGNAQDAPRVHGGAASRRRISTAHPAGFEASTPESRHVELYELLGVPTKIMTPRKTWSDGEAPYSDAKNA